MSQPITSDSIRVYLVDDHPLVRRSLADVVNDESDMRICGEASTCEEALAQIPEVRPHVVVADISLGDRSGLELIRDLREQHPSIAILVLTMHDEATLAHRALKDGASGYLMKSEEPEEVVKGIRAVAGGRVYVSEAQNNRMVASMLHHGLDAHIPSACLSSRELAVFEHYGRGLRTSEIAALLDISSKTVETYRKRIKTKLNLPHGSDLLRSAMSWVERDSRA